MKSLKVIMLAVLVLTVAGLAQAATIALVSDAYAPDDPAADKNHNDDTFVAFLEGLGYTVDTTGMGKNFREGDNSPFVAGNEDKLAVLENADLIIVTRRTNATSYDKDRMAWNSLTTPLILNNGQLIRGEGSNKFGWVTDGSSASKDEDGKRTFTDLNIIGRHPFLPVPQVFDWSLAPTPGEGPNGVNLPNSSGDVIGGTIIAEYGEDRPFLIDYQAGTDFDAGNGTTDKYGVAGARRAFVAHWSYNNGLADTSGSDGGPSDWEDYITDDYKDILAGTIATMIPEPATLALLGLGGLLLRRRR